MRRLTPILAVALLAFFATFTRAQSTQPAQAQHPTPAVLIPVKGTIDDFTRDQLVKRLDVARQLGAKTVILQLDTYGGVVTSALDISRHLKSLDDLHTIAYVDDKAISAGALIALACDEIVMTPDAVLGDCAPISIAASAVVPVPATERAKMESPILADFRDSSLKHGYDPLLTSAMVSLPVTVHYVQKDATGGAVTKRFVDDTDYAALTKDGWTAVPDLPNPVDGPTSLLTVHATDAQALGLAKAIERSPTTLAASRDLNLLATLTPSSGERLIDLLISPAARGVLLIIFMQALYLALHNPGHGAAEAVATVSLGLLLAVPLLTGYAQWYEILMILAGLALLAFEFFVFPGHLVSAAAGILLMVAGFVMTFVPKEPTGLPGFLPTLQTTYHGMQTGLVVVVGAALASCIGFAVLSKYLPQIPYFNRLVLPASVAIGSSAAPSHAASPFHPCVGDLGVALTPLRPGGSAKFSLPEGNTPDQILPVLSDAGFVDPGTPVVVRDTSNNRILVRPAPTA